ncbi:MAG TPA: SLBB domain-containing protein [Synechococcales cyanobacterium M55_K2018_004]|nr:SLBB domain-containing protein [Synechococcales cyanobacterium M55_K2018_004]
MLPYATRPLAPISLAVLMAIAPTAPTLAQLIQPTADSPAASPPTPLPSQQIPLLTAPRRLPGAQPTSPLPAAVPTTYTLGAGDRIHVDVFRVPGYSGEREVLVNGTLNLPMVGSIAVQNLTLEQAEAAISAAYSRFLRRPIVTVTLLAARPLQVGIAGEITRPGSYSLTLQGSQFPTVTRLLQTAGGVTQAADLRRAQIRRLVGNRTQVINVDLWALIQNGDLRNDVSLRDGDTVFIPTAERIDLAEAPQIAAASFAATVNQPVNVAVAGEVFRPGPYTVSGGTARTGEAGVPGGSAGSSNNVPTVTRAIQMAGGIKPMADIRRIQVRRLTRSGTEQILQANLWDLLQKGDLRQDVILQEGDTILIPTATEMTPEESAQIAAASFSPSVIRVNVVGEVNRPGAIELPPNVPMNQAILAAGGFNTRARRSSVRLIRVNPNGTVTQRRIEVDFAQNVNDANNPTLYNNDVIVVGRSDIASAGDALGNLLRPVSGILSILNLPFRIFNLFD